jgi:hypothetical protein
MLLFDVIMTTRPCSYTTYCVGRPRVSYVTSLRILLLIARNGSTGQKKIVRSFFKSPKWVLGVILVLRKKLW